MHLYTIFILYKIHNKTLNLIDFLFLNPLHQYNAFQQTGADEVPHRLHLLLFQPGPGGEEGEHPGVPLQEVPGDGCHGRGGEGSGHTRAGQRRQRQLPPGTQDIPAQSR